MNNGIDNKYVISNIPMNLDLCYATWHPRDNIVRKEIYMDNFMKKYSSIKRFQKVGESGVRKVFHCTYVLILFSKDIPQISLLLCQHTSVGPIQVLIPQNNYLFKIY